MLSGAVLLLAAKSPDLPVVPQVDLKRYAGKWFEIARLPNRFQGKCTSNVTATYTLQASGKVRVVNSCKQRDGKVSEISGTARAATRSLFSK
ncbi:MAG: lipocalin family protein [Acidobacteriota bacterium]|nr:lipocalin family protein [Acidobacteriota bacterium]